MVKRPARAPLPSVGSQSAKRWSAACRPVCCNVARSPLRANARGPIASRVEAQRPFKRNPGPRGA
eukprot:4332847-Lingulodinium_polyedra.AAC.1